MLNEDVDYLSLISEDQRQLYNNSFWTISGGTATELTAIPTDTPFVNSTTTNISANVPSGATGQVKLTSVFDVPLDEFYPEYANFSLAFHAYVTTPFVDSIAFGYEYYDPIAMITKEEINTKESLFDNIGQWVFDANTFKFPPDNAEDIKFVIYINTSSGGTASDYNVYINGISLGQWSEEFHKNSLGVITQPVPSDIALGTNGDVSVVPAFPYGSSDKNAYYTHCTSDNRLHALNFGVPLVYGSDNITKIYPHEHGGNTYPSLLFPGYGFLSEYGKNNEYTIEMWVRLATDAKQPRKLFGPINSNDGVYVEGGFLTLVIGNKHESFYVGDWYRPMLIHVRYQFGFASLLLNGEQVLSMNLEDSDMNFPLRYTEDNKDQDWLGFYTYEDVRPVEIESMAIYSYQVPTLVAKRRWVWGQGVAAPESTNSAYNPTTAFVDYSFANYAANYNYPDIADWRQAYFSNVETTVNSVGLPEYALPDINIPGKTYQEWLGDVKEAQTNSNVFYTLKPNSSYDSLTTYLYFEKLGLLTDTVESMYVVAESDGNASNETIVKLVNKLTKDYLVVYVDGTTVKYDVNVAGSTSTLATKTITEDTPFTVGINLRNLSQNTTQALARLFSDQDNVEIFAAGDLDSSFSGKVYRVGFESRYNNRKINSFYDAQGIFEIDKSTELLSHTANYTLKAFDKYGLFFLDIAVAGYWEDYIPLSYFGKNIDDYTGVTDYEIDSVQINFDYPEPLEINSLEFISSWTYGDLRVRYQSPVQLTYEDLANNFYTGWEDYEDLSQDSEKFFYYETGESSVKAFVSFQFISNGVNKRLIDFDEYSVPKIQNIVDPSVSKTYWEDTAFEIVDGTIVYPPEINNLNNSVDFEDLALTYHLEFKSEGILHNPIRFRNLQLASQVLERAVFTEIGTKFGTTTYPYRRLGQYFDFKGQNPIEIYKQSTPHLYLTRDSGWSISGNFAEKPENQLAVVEQAIGDGTSITYISNNSFIAGQEVTITGLNIGTGQDLNINKGTIISATPSAFVVASDKIGQSSGQGLATVELEGFVIVDRGIAIPINQQQGLDVEVSALQMWIRFADRAFPNQPISLFTIDFPSQGETYEFYLQADSSFQRGLITARLASTGEILENVQFFLNGNQVDDAYITNEDWVVLGVAFPEPLLFDGTVGSINLNGPLTYNNVSYFLSSNVAQQERVNNRLWSGVINDPEEGALDWDYWTSSAWSEVKILSTDATFGFSPADIYDLYVGNNRIVIDDYDRGLVLDPEQVSVYSDVEWSISTQTPV